MHTTTENFKRKLIATQESENKIEKPQKRLQQYPTTSTYERKTKKQATRLQLLYRTKRENHKST